MQVIEWKRFVGALGTLLFPPHCVLCREPTCIESEGLLCLGCREGVFKITTPVCLVCGQIVEAEEEESPKKTIEEPTQKSSKRKRAGRRKTRFQKSKSAKKLKNKFEPLDEKENELICFRCVQARPSYDGLYGMYAYAGAIRELLHRFKYQHSNAAGRVLRELFAEQAKDAAIPWAQYAWIAPVPLHRKRLAKRGFNQAWFLLQSLFPHIEVIQERATFSFLQRSAWTPPQAGLSREKRLQNLQGALELHPRYRHGISGKSVLLVDDVLTTGATAEQCAQLLKHYGAKRVDLLVLCRTII